jgi:hypothetical protein
MSFYHWLGAEAERFHAAGLLEAYGYIEADGFVTVYPEVR